MKVDVKQAVKQAVELAWRIRLALEAHRAKMTEEAYLQSKGLTMDGYREAFIATFIARMQRNLRERNRRCH